MYKINDLVKGPYRSTGVVRDIRKVSSPFVQEYVLYLVEFEGSSPEWVNGWYLEKA